MLMEYSIITLLHFAELLTFHKVVYMKVALLNNCHAAIVDMLNSTKHTHSTNSKLIPKCQWHHFVAYK